MPIRNQGLKPLTEINACVVRDNQRSFIGRTDIDTVDLGGVKKRIKSDSRVFLVNPGPSSRTSDGLDLQKQMDRINQINVLCGSAVSFIDSGLVDKNYVDAVVFSNPESAYETCFSEGTDLNGVDVFVAQQCKPEVFDQLKKTGAFIIPFDAYIEGISHEATYTQHTSESHAYASRDLTDCMRDQHMGFGFEPAPIAPTAIAIGYGAAVSAVSLFSHLGFRDFEAIGWDGTKEYTAGLEHFNIADDEPNPFDNDVKEFGLLITSNPGAVKSIYLHGDGPTAKLLNAEGNKPRTDFSALSKVNFQPHKHNPKLDKPRL
jgi:hypothetical protein